jgi:hypothetical protein
VAIFNGTFEASEYEFKKAKALMFGYLSSISLARVTCVSFGLKSSLPHR